MALFRLVVKLRMFLEKLERKIMLRQMKKKFPNDYEELMRLQDQIGTLIKTIGIPNIEIKK